MTEDVTASKNLGGRPSIYTPELAAEICVRLMEGLSLRTICKDDDMPGLRTVFTWLNDDETFAAQYTKAREVQADTMADDVVDIADTVMPGERRTTKADGKVEVVTIDMVERSKLRVDARKWRTEMLNPKKYSAKHNVSGPGQDGAIILRVQPALEGT